MEWTVLVQEIRHGARSLVRGRGFALAAVISIAVGIAAATAVFSVAYGAVLNPFPYRDPWGIVTIRLQNLKTPQFRAGFSDAESRAYSASPVFTETMVCTFEPALWTGNGEPDTVRTVLMSGGAFDFLGVPALLGRTFTRADAPDGREPEPVVVLSYFQWQQKFGGSRSVLNQKILLNGKPFVVIGVMPPRFTWYGRESVWIPVPLEGRQARFFLFRGRLRSGLSLEGAGERLQVISKALAAQRPATFPREGFRTVVVSMKDFSVSSGSLRKSFVPLLIAVGLLLMIACTNVANLLLARATAQRREIAIRAAMGASRARIIRQVLIQSVMLSLTGAVAGAALAGACLRSIVRLIPPLSLPDEAVISLDVTVLLFCVGLAILTGILFGLAPAIEGSRVDLQETLKDAGRGQSDARGARMRSALVVAELALSMFLLVSAAFTLRSFTALETTDPGFRPERVLLANVQLPRTRYRTAEAVAAFYDQALERVSLLPQVRAAAVGLGGVPSIFLSGSLRGDTVLPVEQKIGIAYISADYFKVLSIALRKGRFMTADEVRRNERLAVINETAARLFWRAGEDPLGRNVLLAPVGSNTTGPEIPLTVIGVAADTRNDGLTNPPRPAIFLPSSLAPQPFRSIVIQTGGRPEAITASVRRALHELDTALPLANTLPLEKDLENERVGPRFMSVLFLFFAGIGLILAACGTYGVMSYSVSRRTYEFGIRMALGAQRWDVMSDVVRRGMVLAGTGVIVGLSGALLIARVYRQSINETTYLKNFNENDPLAVVVVSAGLLLVALVACYLPARRAATADPSKSLRYE